MPKHLAIGANSLSGTINFDNIKSVRVTFSPAFNKIPRIVLTLNNTSALPPYKTLVTKSSFTINFQSAYTGEVEWMAMERE